VPVTEKRPSCWKRTNELIISDARVSHEPQCAAWTRFEKREGDKKGIGREGKSASGSGNSKREGGGKLDEENGRCENDVCLNVAIEATH